jgi:hypothetical protein
MGRSLVGNVHTAGRRAARLAHVIDDGTLVLVDCRTIGTKIVITLSRRVWHRC